MPSSPQEIYTAQRDTLVTQIKEIAERDERIRAAWLFGSLGRGTADILSDIDVFFVVTDEYIAEISAQRREYVAQIGNPQLLVEAPQNAPQDGAYLMVWYSLNNIPCCVDWYWQPQSQAVIPAETIILCDKDGLPRKDTPTQFDGYQPVPETTPLESVTDAFAFS